MVADSWTALITEARTLSAQDSSRQPLALTDLTPYGRGISFMGGVDGDSREAELDRRHLERATLQLFARAARLAALVDASASDAEARSRWVQRLVEHVGKAAHRLLASGTQLIPTGPQRQRVEEINESLIDLVLFNHRDANQISLGWLSDQSRRYVVIAGCDAYAARMREGQQALTCLVPIDPPLHTREEYFRIPSVLRETIDLFEDYESREGERVRTMPTTEILAEWLQRELDNRGWDVHQLEAHGGPSWKTSRLMLAGNTVGKGVLEKVASAFEIPVASVPGYKP